VATVQRSSKRSSHARSSPDPIRGEPLVSRLEIAPELAHEAGLVYSTDDSPGYRRVKRGKGFIYLDTHRRQIKDLEVLQRIHLLRIPPAWTDVWICASKRGHLQATGRDARGRKQYRYHSEWDCARDSFKYDRMIAFAKSLPRIRRRIARDVKKIGLPREKVLAAMLRLMDRTAIRVGNEEYVRANHSYGLTTLQDRHAQIKGGEIKLSFRGKSGKTQHIELTDAGLAKIVRECQELPGQELFQYLDEQGDVCDVTSRDVNEYLRGAGADDFTAKDFRTWAGTTIAVEALMERLDSPVKTSLKRNVNAALDSVAAQLGNTRAVCRKSYVHPGVIEAYLLGRFERSSDHPKGYTGLSALEVSVLVMLERLSQASKPKKSRKLAS
jgi:DNA topoisomerase-1